MTTGATIAHMPIPHRQPMPPAPSTLSVMGPAAQVVKMYGVVANESMSARLFKVEVSAMKMVMT